MINISQDTKNILNANYLVRQIVEDRKHFYEVTAPTNVKRFRSVTDYLSVINKPALPAWAARETANHIEKALLGRLGGKESASIILNEPWIKDVMKDGKKTPEKIKDQAADYGTLFHKILEKIVGGEEPEIPKELNDLVSRFEGWLDETKTEFMMGEMPVASLQYEYGGSFDAVGRRGDEIILFDWKTSNSVYPEHALQLGAYAQALYETFGWGCDRAMIVRFSKTPPYLFEVHEVFDLERSLKAFLDAKSLKESLEKPQFLPI